MELTSDLIAVQGLLLSTLKNTGDFTKILYKGGNELKINEVIKELEEFLESKRYLEKRKCSKLHQKELEAITFFLILNSQFDEKVKAGLAEYAHLTQVAPTLSQCLLASIVVELGLVEPYCGALHLMPVEVWDTLLVETLHCVKKSPPEHSIKYTYVFVKNIIAKISSIDLGCSKMGETIGSLEDIVKQLLLNCSSITLEVAQGMKRSRIYKLMGLSLLTLLKLLQCCQVDNETILRTIGNLINTATGIVTAVTLDVFCTWAEVQYQGFPLQTVIGEEAYQVIEKYQKFKPAKELSQMLASISKKPRTLSEQIQLADTSTIIHKVTDDVENRRKWFRALLRTDIFSNPAAINCLRDNCHLCSLEDIYHLLNTLIYHKTQENVDLFLKCASCLSESDLISLLMRYYYHHGLKNSLGGDNHVIDQLILILNKLDPDNNELNRDLILLLICEPKLVLKHLYKECIKSNLVTDCLKATFRGISDFIEIEGLFLTILAELFLEIKLGDDNLEHYKKLLEVLCEKTSACNKVINAILEPNCSKCLKEKDLESLHLMLVLYIGIVNNSSEQETRRFLELCCSILEDCRWIIFDFSNVKVELCQLAAESLLLHRDSKVFPISFTSKYPLNGYYVSNSQTEAEFFNRFIPKFSEDDRSEPITWLLRVLPLCLVNEWSHITKHLAQTFGAEKILELYAEVLILISELVKTQTQEGSQNIWNGLKYCVQNYGFIVKNVFVTLNREDIDVSIARNVCKLLNHLPKEMENVEAMCLASVIPENALKSLSRDQGFVSTVRSLKNHNIAVSIVRRMLN